MSPLPAVLILCPDSECDLILNVFRHQLLFAEQDCCSCLGLPWALVSQTD